jgi:hypothetical protein
MESTGVYGKPVYAIRGDFEIIVADEQRLRTSPGGKTDVKDAEGSLRNMFTVHSGIC